MRYRTVVLTMDPLSDRCLETVRQLSTVGILDPILITGFVLRDFLLFAPKRNQYRNVPENAATLSHYDAIAKYATPDQHLLVVEDDLFLRDSFAKEFPKYLEYLEANDTWDLFYFYNTGNHSLTSSFGVFKNAPSYCTHFYLINKRATTKISNLCTRYNRVIDDVYLMEMQANLLEVWSSSQNLACQWLTKYGSAIGGKKREKLLKKFPGVFV